MSNNDPTEKKTISLEPGDITEVPSMHRRSALGSIGAAIGAALSVIILRPETAEACQRTTGRTDSDSGNNADSPNHGHTGQTDADSGDESRCGRGGGGRSTGRRTRSRQTGITDSDSGPNADGAGHGRGGTRRSCTDSDSGPNADGAGRGRNC